MRVFAAVLHGLACHRWGIITFRARDAMTFSAHHTALASGLVGSNILNSVNRDQRRASDFIILASNGWLHGQPQVPTPVHVVCGPGINRQISFK